jgi:hypothetical protein
MVKDIIGSISSLQGFAGFHIVGGIDHTFLEVIALLVNTLTHLPASQTQIQARF